MEFRQLSGQERGFSDIAPPAAAVASPSGGSTMQTLASAFQIAGSALDIGMKISDKQQESAQNEALARGTEEFEQQLVRGSMMLEQGASSAGVRQATTKWFNDSQLPFDVKAKMMKQWESLSLGKSFNEPTDKEREAAQLEKMLIASKLVLPGASEEEKSAATIQLEKLNAETVQHKALLMQAEAVIADTTISKPAKEVALAEKKAILKKQYSNLIVNSPTTIDNTLTPLLEKYQSGGFSTNPAENEILYNLAIDQEKTAFIGRMNLLALDNPTDAAPFKAIANESLLPRFDAFNSKADSNLRATTLENLKREVIGAAGLRLVSNETVATYAAAVSAGLYAQGGLTQDMSTFVNNTVIGIEKAANENRQFNNLGPDNPATKEYLTTLSNSIKGMGTVGSDGKPVMDEGVQLRHFNQVIGYLGNSSKEDNTALVKLLAEPHIIQFVSDNQDKIPQELMDNANKSIKEYGLRMKEVSDKALLSIDTPESLQAKRDKILAVNPNTKFDETRRGLTTDEIGMEVLGGRLLLTGSTERGREKAAELNNSLAKPFTTLLRAQSALQPQVSLDKLGEVMRAAIWPSKYGEQAKADGQTETQGEAQADVPNSESVAVGMTVPNTPEGKVSGTFKKGNNIIVVSDGVITEVR